MSELDFNFTDTIRWEMHRLHIPPTLLGHHFLVHAITIVAKDPMRAKNVTKDLYPETARRFGTSWRAVERNIRFAVRTCWNSGGREALVDMAGYPLAERPRTAVFIAIVARYVGRDLDRGPERAPEWPISRAEELQGGVK